MEDYNTTLIIIDGLDASGKNTQAQALCRLLVERGKTVLLRFHPSNDTAFGVRSRYFLYSRGRSAHFASAFFYMVDVLRSVFLYSWRKFDFVIFVRYLMGTAYLPSPLYLIAYFFFSVFVPNSKYKFFLDVHPQEAFERIRRTRERREMFENLEKLEATRVKALSLAANYGWIIIDANQTVEATQYQIWKFFQ